MAYTRYEEAPARKRFSKPADHFLNTIKGKPARCLRHIFENFHLVDFREELNLWLRIALSSGQDAYGEGAAREDLQDFVDRLHRLIEAFCMIQMVTGRETMALETRRVLDKANRPFYLTEPEWQHPGRVIKAFRKTFRYGYVKTELLDMLEAVVIYEGTQLLCKNTLVVFYQHLKRIVGLAYKHPPDLWEIQNPPGS